MAYDEYAFLEDLKMVMEKHNMREIYSKGEFSIKHVKEEDALHVNDAVFQWNKPQWFINEMTSRHVLNIKTSRD